MLMPNSELSFYSQVARQLVRGETGAAEAIIPEAEEDVAGAMEVTDESAA
jgi:hypothetical protein